MVESIYTYALFKTLYDKGQDVIDAFWPIILRCFEDDAIYDKKSILEFLNREYDINMPIHVLDTVLYRLIKLKYIRVKYRKNYWITRDGLIYKEDYIDIKDIERKINSLIDDIYNFSIAEGYSYSLQDINGLLMNIMKNNVSDLLELINPSIITENDINIEGEYIVIEKYIREASVKKPEYYNILREMIFGSLISSVLYTKGYLDLSSINKVPIKDTIMYLDTNFIFSLFDLHSKEQCEPIKELYDLMQLNNIKMKAFSFTLDEISRVLNGYISEYHKYPKTIRIEDLYSIMKINGWSKSDVKEFITNIDRHIEKRGIDIEWVPKFDVDNYKPTDPNLPIKIFDYKPNMTINTMKHDLLALEKIIKIRSKPIRRFDQTKTFFLTCDIRLNRFNMNEMGHRSNGTICETILDRTLTNLLWLRNPESSPSLQVILSAHSTTNIVKKSVWDSFFKTLSILKTRGIVDGHDITMLFYDGYMEDILSVMKERDEYKISQDFVIQHVEKARNIEGVIRQDIKDQLKSEYDKMFDERISELETIKEQDKQEEWLKNILEIKENIRINANKTATFFSTILSAGLTVIILICLYVLYNYFIKMNMINLYTLFLPLFVGGGGIWGIVKSLRILIKEKTEHTYYTEQIKNLKLDDYNNDKKDDPIPSVRIADL